jgi:hypothetical protein
MEVVVEMLKNKQAGILRASRALLASTAECHEPHGCLAQQHRTREKHIRSGERREPDHVERTARLRRRLKPRGYLSSALASSVWHAQFTKRVAK